MANKKITALPTAGTLDGSELAEIVQGGVNKKVTTQEIADLAIAGGATDYSRHAVTISGGNVATLDMNNVAKQNFDITATRSSAFTIAFSNAANMVEAVLTMRLTGSIAITMPSTVEMQQYETTNSRWNTSTQILTLVGTTATRFMISFYFDGTVHLTQASDSFE